MTSARHQKRHDAFIVNKTITDSIKNSANNVITNLTRFELTEDEVEVLNIGSKHRVLSRPEESDMVATTEYIWEQLTTITFLKKITWLNKQYKQPNVLSHITT